MASANPCLGCGFELDSQGYLVRVDEIEKQSVLSRSFAPTGSFKYCDPTTQRSWDVPWVMPWGLMDESVSTLNVNLPFGSTPLYVFGMPGTGAFSNFSGLYAPYRRLRLEGWVECTVGGNSPAEITVTVNATSSLPLSTQLAGAAGFNVPIPISIGISGPSLGPWAGFWSVSDIYSGQYLQFRLNGRTAAGSNVAVLARLALSIFDDGPATGVFYTVQQRYWPSPLPYP